MDYYTIDDLEFSAQAVGLSVNRFLGEPRAVFHVARKAWREDPDERPAIQIAIEVEVSLPKNEAHGDPPAFISRWGGDTYPLTERRVIPLLKAPPKTGSKTATTFSALDLAVGKIRKAARKSTLSKGR